MRTSAISRHRAAGAGDVGRGIRSGGQQGSATVDSRAGH